MQPNRFRTLVAHLWQGIGPPRAAATDAELLSEYASGARPEAFAELLQRHGRLVYGACRRILGNTHDAEDAFQATFLVLARKAGSVRWQASAASWLYLAACQTARQARTRAQRQRQRELKVAAMTREATENLLEPADWQPLLHAELECLPDRYRLPLLLCYLEGHNTAEAARLLGCPVGTLKVRLRRGRERLRSRLVRRGLTFSAAALATHLQEAAEAAMPAALVSASAQAARLVAAGTTAAGALSIEAITLAEGTVHAMFRAKMITAAAVLLAAMVLAVGTAGLGFQLLAGHAVGDETPAAAQQEQPKAGQPPAAVRTDLSGAPLPSGALARLGDLRFRHDGWVYSVNFSQDGKTLVSGTHDAAYVWDAASGQVIRRVPWKKGNEFMCIAPDGKTVAWAEPSGTTHLWDMSTGREIRQFLVPKFGHRGAFSPDGKTLAVAGGDGKETGIHLLDVATGQVIRQFQGDGALCFWPDGKTLGSHGGHHQPKARDVATGQERHQFKGLRPLCFSQDGKTMAGYASDPDSYFGVIAVYDATTGQQLCQLKEKERGDAFFAVCYAPDGKTIATGGQYGPIQLWDVATGQGIRQLNGHTTRVQSLCYAADGKTLASASNDGTVRLWDPADGKQISPSQHSLGIAAIRYAPDAKTILTASKWGGTFLLWDAATGKEFHRFHCPAPGGPSAYVEDVRFSPDGKALIVCAALNSQLSNAQFIGVHGWDPTAKELPKLWQTNAVTSFCYAPDSKTLALGRWLAPALNGETVLCDAATGKVIRQLQGVGASSALCFASDGKALISTGGEGKIRHWDPTTGKEIHQPLPEQQRDDNRFYFDLFAPDGKTFVTVSTASNKSIRVWDTLQLRDVATGKVIRHFQYTGSFACCSPDGKTLVSVDGKDGSIRLWEIASGKEIRRFQEPLAPCTGCVTFAPDGLTMASLHANSTVLVWDVTAGGGGTGAPRQP
jgi:RNA polymerase sigma factor (sigma-70 family)